MMLDSNRMQWLISYTCIIRIHEFRRCMHFEGIKWLWSNTTYSLYGAPASTGQHNGWQWWRKQGWHPRTPEIRFGQSRGCSWSSCKFVCLLDGKFTVALAVDVSFMGSMHVYVSILLARCKKKSDRSLVAFTGHDQVIAVTVGSADELGAREMQSSTPARLTRALTPLKVQGECNSPRCHRADTVTY